MFLVTLHTASSDHHTIWASNHLTSSQISVLFLASLSTVRFLNCLPLRVHRERTTTSIKSYIQTLVLFVICSCRSVVPFGWTILVIHSNFSDREIQTCSYVIWYINSYMLDLWATPQCDISWSLQARTLLLNCSIRWSNTYDLAPGVISFIYLEGGGWFHMVNTYLCFKWKCVIYWHTKGRVSPSTDEIRKTTL